MDLSKLNVSNGSGEAVRALVTVLRAPGGTVITPNSLVNWPTNFVATTGPLLADGTLDPIKTIVFMGRVVGSTFVIDQLAPGYTDTYGSAVGDVVVIKPNTWAQDTHVNATTTNKNDIATINTNTFPLRQREGSFDYIASGGVITGDSYGVTRIASATAIIAYINGVRQTVAAVTARTYTASKDTYIDILYNASGVATLVYTEVANNAGSPVLATDSIRVGIVVTGASNIANVAAINQGQEDKLLPIASSIAYAVADSLGNLITPRDPNRKLLCYRKITSNFATTSGAAVQVTGLSATINAIPAGRKLKITFNADSMYTSLSASSIVASIYDGVVGVGTRLTSSTFSTAAVNQQAPSTMIAIVTPNTTSKTYNIGFYTTGGTGQIACTSTNPAIFMVELQ